MRRLSIAPKFQRLEVVTSAHATAFRVPVKSLGEAVALLRYTSPRDASLGQHQAIHQAIADAATWMDREDFEAFKGNADDPWWGIELAAEIPGLELHITLGLKAEPAIHVTIRTSGAEVLRTVADSLQKQVARLLEELAAIESKEAP